MSIRGRWRGHLQTLIQTLCRELTRPYLRRFRFETRKAYREAAADMPKLAIIATIDVAPGRRDQLLHFRIVLSRHRDFEL